MNKNLKKGLVFISVYLVLLLCVFMMSDRIERLDNSAESIKGTENLSTLEYNTNS